MWINDGTDPDLWDGIRVAYDVWNEVPSSYFTVVDSGFTPINYVNAYDGVNVVSFSNDSTQFPPGSNTIAFTSGNWGARVGDDYTITGFDVIFNDVGFNFGYPPPPGAFSVVGIAGHELGHAWALAHCWEGGPPGCGPNCTTSTMYGYSSPPGTSDESLELDDIASITLAYPKWLLQGLVRDAGTHDPLDGAPITATAPVAKDTLIYGSLPDSLPGNGSTCGYVGGAISTDGNGNFEMATLDSVYDIVVFKSGYMPDTLQVAFTGIETLQVRADLGPSALSSITGTLTDEGTQEGINGFVVLMQNGQPYDTVATDAVTGAFTFSDVPVSLPPFVVYTGVELLASMPYPRSEEIDTTIEVTQGGPSVVDFAISPADVFLVDDDGGDTYEDYFMNEINAVGRTYYHFDINAEGESAVNYVGVFPLSSIVLWFTGDVTENTLSQTEQDSLENFLDRGGDLFLTGQNIAEDLDAQGYGFLEDYLHVTHEGNASYFMARGVFNNPVTGFLQSFVTSGSGGANNQTSRDILSPAPPAEEFIYYVASPADLTPLGTAATYVEGPSSSKAILMGFGFEAINSQGDDSTRVTREEAMLAILNWFDDIVGIGDNDVSSGGPALPRAFALKQNYPNPFNPQTSIQFAIPAEEGGSEAEEKVVLKVYDMRGRMVDKLVDKALSPGIYTVQWDGKDSRGVRVPSGVYFYKLIWGDQSSTRKMVVLK